MKQRKPLSKKMNERGYTESFEHRNSQDETVSISFLYMPDEESNDKRFPVPSYSVTVWVKDGDFQFTYAMANSIDVLQSPKCSPVMNDEHFYRLAIRFEREAAVLAKYCS